MKKIFVSLSFMLVVGLSTVLGNDEPVSDKVKQSFEETFVGAKSVKWNQVGDYQMASFVFASQSVIAYFNTDGELEASVRGLLFDQLPLLVMISFEERFATADLIDILEVSNRQETCYLLQVEMQNKRLRIKADTNGNFLKVDKIKK